MLKKINLLCEEEIKNYEIVKKYTECFSNDKLINYENQIFGQLNKKERILAEYKRLRKLLSENSEDYAKYLQNLVNLKDKIELLEFDSTLIEEITKDIVNLELLCDIPIRLYSILPNLKMDYEYKLFIRKTELLDITNKTKSKVGR